MALASVNQSRQAGNPHYWVLRHLRYDRFSKTDKWADTFLVIISLKLATGATHHDADHCPIGVTLVQSISATIASYHSIHNPDQPRMKPTSKGTSPDTETSTAVTQRYNARLGILLFVIYLALYLGFVLLNAFAPSAMEWRPGGGINLALLYGFGLIVAALALAFVYGMLAKVSAADAGQEAAK